MKTAKELLSSALRQYRHNHGSEQMICGYEYDETLRLVELILLELDRAERRTKLAEDTLKKVKPSDANQRQLISSYFMFLN